MYAIGIDVGATKINFVLLRGQTVLKKRKILTPKTKEKIIKVLEENIKCLTLLNSRKANLTGLIFDVKKEISGIGIGVPGPLNEKRDLVLNPPNLRSLRNCPLAKIIEKDLKIKTEMDNDVNCFTLGEALIGAGKGAKIVMGLTLGSGVGGGAVIDGKLYRGAFGSAGEIGHMTIKFDGPKCTCGSYGCFEEYCSERFFKRKKVSSLEIENKAKKNGRIALNLYNEYGKYLGIGLSNIINLLDPEIIVLGGGISNAHRFFIKSAKTEIRKRVISPISKKYVKIKRAELANLSGAIGAALLVKN